MQEIGCWRIVKRNGMERDLHSEYIFLIKSLFFGDCDFDFECVILQCILLITFMSVSNVIALRWIVQDSIDDIKNNAWVTVNNDFWVTSEAICQ